MCPYAIELHVTGKLQEEKNKKPCIQESEVKNAHPSWWVLCYKEEQQTSLPRQQMGFTQVQRQEVGVQTLLSIWCFPEGLGSTSGRIAVEK